MKVRLERRRSVFGGVCQRLGRESLWAFPHGAPSVSTTSWGPAWVASAASQLPAQGPDGCSAHGGTEVAGSGCQPIPAAPSMVPATWRRGRPAQGDREAEDRTRGESTRPGSGMSRVPSVILQGALPWSAGLPRGPRKPRQSPESASAHHSSVYVHLHYHAPLKPYN